MYKLKLMVVAVDKLGNIVEKLEDNVLLAAVDRDVILEAYEIADAATAGLIAFTHGRFDMGAEEQNDT